MAAALIVRVAQRFDFAHLRLSCAKMTKIKCSELWPSKPLPFRGGVGVGLETLRKGSGPHPLRLTSKLVSLAALP